MPQLENRTSILARPETTYGLDSIAPNLAAVPSSYAVDALQVSAFDVKVNGDVLTRDNYSPSLSHDNIGMGRMLLQMTFTAELKSSGVLGVPPRVGRLIKACGFQETVIANTAAATIGSPVPGVTNTSTAAAAIVSGLVKTTAPAKCFDTYRITFTTGGAAGAAKFIVTGPGFPDNDIITLNSLQHSANTNSANGIITIGGTLAAPTVTFSGTFAQYEFVEVFIGGIRFFYQIQAGDTVTSIATAIKNAILTDAIAVLAGGVSRFAGTSSAAGVITVTLTAANGEIATTAAAQNVTLGASSAVVQLPAWAGAVVAGEYLDIPLLRPGVRYDPVSDNFTSLTFYAFLDGSLFRLTGARGTFSVDGQAAKYPTMSFTFTGIYNDPIDAPLPTSLGYENTKPYKVELAQLAVYGMQNAAASKFTFDIANTVEAKDNINFREGYDEIRITDRVPVAGCDPESQVPSVFNPWWRLRREDTTRFHVAVGRVAGTGNIIRIQGDELNWRDVPFANRNKIRAYDFQMQFSRITDAGNNECFLHFG